MCARRRGGRGRRPNPDSVRTQMGQTTRGHGRSRWPVGVAVFGAAQSSGFDRILFLTGVPSRRILLRWMSLQFRRGTMVESRHFSVVGDSHRPVSPVLGNPRSARMNSGTCLAHVNGVPTVERCARQCCAGRSPHCWVGRRGLTAVRRVKRPTVAHGEHGHAKHAQRLPLRSRHTGRPGAARGVCVSFLRREGGFGDAHIARFARPARTGLAEMPDGQMCASPSRLHPETRTSVPCAWHSYSYSKCVRQQDGQGTVPAWTVPAIRPVRGHSHQILPKGPSLREDGRTPCACRAASTRCWHSRTRVVPEVLSRRVAAKATWATLAATAHVAHMPNPYHTPRLR